MLLNKPDSMSVREWLTRVVSQREKVLQSTVDAVIKHQFEGAHNALMDNDSIEISGFGKFLYNKKKAEREMRRLKEAKEVMEKSLREGKLSEQKRHSYEKKLVTVDKNIEHLNRRNGTAKNI